MSILDQIVQVEDKNEMIVEDTLVQQWTLYKLGEYIRIE